MNKVLVSRGRLADRIDGLAEGALLTGKRIAESLDITLKVIGTPSPAEIDSWDQALEKGRTVLNEIHSQVVNQLRTGSPVWLANNTCSASIGSIAGAATVFPNLNVLYIDAHPDFNRPDQSTSGYLGGMALAAAAGLWDSGFEGNVNPSKCYFFGARDIDSGELENIESLNATILSPDNATTQTILEQIEGPIWVHIDWDSTDPFVIPADYSVPGGLQIKEINDFISKLPTHSIVGAELSEFLPNTGRRSNEDALSDIGTVVKTIEGKMRK